MKRLAVALLLAVAAAVFAVIAVTASPAPAARADINGTFPCPGLPSYPFIGQCGYVGIVPYYFADGPTEANGSHWHCEAGGVSAAGGGFTGSNGIGIAGLGNFGFAFGSCYFKWPDGALAPPPNPPGAWNHFLVPRAIPADHAAPPQPYNQTVDVAPPPVVNDIPQQDGPPPIVEAPKLQPPIIPPPAPAPPAPAGPPPPEPDKVECGPCTNPSTTDQNPVTKANHG